MEEAYELIEDMHTEVHHGVADHQCVDHFQVMEGRLQSVKGFWKKNPERMKCTPVKAQIIYSEE